MKNTEIIVSICCTTYNQSPYIRQCLDGFLIQKTDFPIEIVIHDDASTDGTDDIIRGYELKYPDLFKPIYQTENQFSKSIHLPVKLTYEKAVGKYIAICEGDDYWTDPYKLQKQVDFLEQHSDYSLCYSKILRYDQKRKKILRGTFGIENITFNDLLSEGNQIPTASICLNRNMIVRYYSEIKPELKNWLMGDYPLVLWFAHNCKIYCLNEVTAIYRVLELSVSHITNIQKLEAFYNSIIDIKCYFLNLYNEAIHLDDFYDEKYLNLAYRASLINDYMLYKENILKIKQNNKMITIKKIIGSCHFFFLLYHYYVIIREKFNNIK